MIINSPFKEEAFAYDHTFDRIVYFSNMLELAKSQIETGGVQEGLWFGKSVISFFLEGTSASTSSCTNQKFNNTKKTDRL
ncbi:hypothetical protein [Rufibacter tibetensis]|uniref:Uncharacterized protein n=1 Tax=Rufibacter tibetensis TaxID=512763 RepID=A0A0N7HWT2_9BACT|nr:hypothetical protein [Rufibacter tibetensis]ALJ00121.1 hypothetical protein DC20_15520 [Rufibacter tibetensis]